MNTSQLNDTIGAAKAKANAAAQDLQQHKRKYFGFAFVLAALTALIVAVRRRPFQFK